MSQRRFEQVESRPAENPNRTPPNVWTEVHNARISNRRVEPRQERTEQPKRATDTPRPEQEAPRRRAEPKTLDCSQGCPFKSATSARSEMRGRESGLISKADAQALRNFDPSKGPMSERLMTALENLRINAMAVGADGKPLWTSYAPTDPAARVAFKDKLFGANPDYREAQELMHTSTSPSAAAAYANTYRNYGEDFSYGVAGYSDGNSTSYKTNSIFTESTQMAMNWAFGSF
jgi:hypothetical protein